MWEIILSLPVMVLAGIVQVTVFSKLHLLAGNVDLIMLIIIVWSLHEYTRYSWVWAISGSLVMTYLSALPLYGYFVIYMLLWVIIWFIKKRVWQMPLIMTLFLTIIGTVAEGAFSLGVLFLQGYLTADGVISSAIQEIIVPSLIINLIAAFPVYGFFTEIANSLYYEKFDL